MKKDIVIPQSEHVSVAAIYEWDDDFQDHVWSAYLVNENDAPLEMAIVISRAFGFINGEERKTSVFRHVLHEVPACGYRRLEMLDKNVLPLNNEFVLTYFLNGVLYDKTFVFEANILQQEHDTMIASIGKKGILAR